MKGWKRETWEREWENGLTRKTNLNLPSNWVLPQLTHTTREKYWPWQHFAPSLICHLHLDDLFFNFSFRRWTSSPKFCLPILYLLFNVYLLSNVTSWQQEWCVYQVENQERSEIREWKQLSFFIRKSSQYKSPISLKFFFLPFEPFQLKGKKEINKLGSDHNYARLRKHC